MAKKDRKSVPIVEKKLNLMALIALGVGSMIGGGIFNSPTDLITEANPQAILIAWLIGGIGVTGIALVFQFLANSRPELTGGIASYAKEGFGDLMGFLSAFGYWISGLLGNVAFITLMMKTLNSLLPPELQLSPLFTFLLSSIILWTIVWLQTRGTGDIGLINLIVTITKLLPLALVIILGFFVWNPDFFFVENWTTNLASMTGPTSATTLFTQINSAMGVILWCFVGVEASTVLAEKAESQKIVGSATVIAILVTVSVYIGISIVAMGVLSPEQLVTAETPLAEVLELTVIGPIGAVIVKLGIIISLLGALISWIMIVGQLPYVAAKEGLLPKVFTKTNHNNTPINVLLMTNGIVQISFLLLLFDELQAIYNIALLLATTTILVPYLFSAMYAYKVSREDQIRGKIIPIAFIAIIYTIYCFITIGIEYLAASFVLYAIGMFPFLKAKKDYNKKMTKAEKASIIAIFILGIVMSILLVTGVITI